MSRILHAGFPIFLCLTASASAQEMMQDPNTETIMKCKGSNLPAGSIVNIAGVQGVVLGQAQIDLILTEAKLHPQAFGDILDAWNKGTKKLDRAMERVKDLNDTANKIGMNDDQKGVWAKLLLGPTPDKKPQGDKDKPKDPPPTGDQKPPDKPGVETFEEAPVLLRHLQEIVRRESDLDRELKDKHMLISEKERSLGDENSQLEAATDKLTRANEAYDRAKKNRLNEGALGAKIFTELQKRIDVAQEEKDSLKKTTKIQEDDLKRMAREIEPLHREMSKIREAKAILIQALGGR